MDRFPPVPASLLPWYVLAEAPRWIFQNIDLPPDPEAFPWSLFCRMIEVEQKEALDNKDVRSTLAFGINNNGEVVGHYVEQNPDDTPGRERGFRRNPDGSIDCF